MFVTRKHLTRRTVLGALGATLGLPLLDAMIPAGTALAQTAATADAARGLHLLPARRGDESLDAGQRGRRSVNSATS